MRWWNLQRRQVLLALPLVMFGLAAASAQPTPAEFDSFKTRIDEAIGTFSSHPRLKGLSQKQREGIAEFVAGNMLFVLLHELAHASISEFDLPVLGKEEDAADAFASLTLIHIKSEFSGRVLEAAAKGWFMSDRRDKAEGDSLPYYDEHGLNQQRAFQIVCYMVGGDPTRFTAVADEVKLPKERQQTCRDDYQKAAKSWGVVLQPHVRTADQPETKIDVAYGDAKGPLEIPAQISRSVKLLEPVAKRSAELAVWPAPFSLEMQTCGFINARWNRPTRKLTLCYELAADFVELYRAYGIEQPDSRPHKKKPPR